MVFYRKYRPQTIDDLDSAAVREKLTAVLKKDIPHAFLFTGPKGLGKTSTARIVAKVVNCERRNHESGIKNQEVIETKTKKKNPDSSFMIPDSSTIEPCNACQQCTSITNGTNLDILEIDAASNRGIDEIRDLKEKIRLAPVTSKMKVYIIDEVHMLTTEAFNALLKTLEEPPVHAMFILCTTEPQKVPSTILSRCFHIAFLLASTDELIRSFKRIVIGENVQVSEESLRMIALLADGGFRDGTKILEEVLTIASGKPITKEFIEEKYQVSSIKYFVFSMVESLAAKDVNQGLQIIDKLVSQGLDVKYFLQQIIEVLHRMLLKQIDTQNIAFDIPDTKLTLGEIKVLFEILSKAHNDMKYAVLPQIPLEMVIIEWADLNNVVAGNDTTKPHSVDMNVVKQSLPESEGQVGDDGVSVASLRKQVGSMKRLKALYGDTKQENATSTEKVIIETTTVELMHTSGDGDVTKEWLDIFWKNLILEMKKHNHTVAGLLRGCTIKSYTNQQLIIQTAYKFHKERLDDMKTRETLLSICKLLTGNNLEVKVELKKS